MLKSVSFFMLACMAILLTSCFEQPVFKQYVEIPMLKWKRENVLKYTIDVKDNKPVYRLGIAFRYASHIPYSEMKVTLDMTSPSGKKMQYNYVVPLKDAKGNHLGEVLHEAADIEKIVEEKFVFVENGKYECTITETMDDTAVVGIQEVGLLLYQPKK